MSKLADVLFIGLDSCDYPTVKKWCSEGKLPVISGLLARSKRMPTEAPVGCYVSAIWPTLYTGSNPATHGTTCWEQITPGTYDLHRHRPGTAIITDTYWQALSRADNKVAAVDIPLSGLTGPVNGAHVVEWGAHNWEVGFQTEPAELKNEILEKVGPSPMEGPCNAWRTTAAEFASFRDNLLAQLEKKTEMNLHLLEKGGWDLFSTVYGESHCIGHHCWHLHDPNHPNYQKEIVDEIGDPVLDIYLALDEAVGRLVEAAGSEAVVALHFTHGFIPKFGATYMMDAFLRKLEAAERMATQMKIAKMVDSLVRAGIRPLASLRDRMVHSANHKIEALAKTLTAADCELFYVPNNHAEAAIRVNLKGREPNGRVSPGTGRAYVFQKIRSILLQLTDTDTGELLVKDVIDLHEKFKGPHQDVVPDFAVIWNNHPVSESIHSTATWIVDNVPLDSCRVGDHTPFGCLSVTGPGCEPEEVERRIDVMDIMPTVCSWLGVDWKEADGTVANELSSFARAETAP